MIFQNVGDVARSGLCCSCGLCIGVCPINSLSLVESGGSWLPKVTDCCSCGRCLAVCPGVKQQWDGDGEIAGQIVGSCRLSASAWSLSKDLFDNAVSGGVTTQLVKSLIEQKMYDVAFLSGPAEPGKRLDAEPYKLGDDLSATQKSKYVQVSHAKTLEYICSHRDERAIVVAVPCAVRGLINAIDLLHLDRENYLFIGLFCDKTMSYGVLDRLSSLGSGKLRVGLVDFRSKRYSGWPGDVVLHYEDGSEECLPRDRRMEVKEFFCPERCLYCLDKLNVLADISLGDDYTGDGANPKGANSVLVRTDRGMRAWSACSGLIATASSTLEEIARSQGVRRRLDNLAFSRMKSADLGISEINSGVRNGDGPIEGPSLRSKYRELISMSRLGAAYRDDCDALENEVRRRRTSMLRRIIERLKRALTRGDS